MNTAFSSLIKPKLFYFVIGCLNYSFYIFKGDYLQTVYGFTGRRYGRVLFFWNLFSFVGAFLWTNLADHLNLHQVILALITVGMGIVFALNTISNTLWFVCTLFAIYGLLIGGLLPLADQQVLCMLSDEIYYGRQVLFNILAYALMTFGIGLALDKRIELLRYLVPTTAFIATIVVLILGNRTVPKKRNAISMAAPIKFDLLFFLYIQLSSGIGRQTLHTFLPLFHKNYFMLSRFQVSTVFFLSCIISLPFYLLAPYLLTKLGVWRLFLLSQLALLTRLLFYGFAPASLSWYWIWLVEPLNGISFCLAHVAGVEEASRLAPIGLVATYQAAYSIAHTSLPAILMSEIGGHINEHYPSYMVFRLVCIIPSISIIVLCLWCFKR